MPALCIHESNLINILTKRKMTFNFIRNFISLYLRYKNAKTNMILLFILFIIDMRFYY